MKKRFISRSDEYVLHDLLHTNRIKSLLCIFFNIYREREREIYIESKEIFSSIKFNVKMKD